MRHFGSVIADRVFQTYKHRLHELKSFMKQYLLTAFLCLSAVQVASAQSIKFKVDYASKASSSSLKFETTSYKGTIKSSPSELVLKVKNKGDKNWSSKQISLVDISNRGEKLCTEKEVILAPKKSSTVHYTSCAANRGLFRLSPSYASKAAFREDAFFLQGKEWTLTIGGEIFTFYTDI